jgi:hypothetical protein
MNDAQKPREAAMFVEPDLNEPHNEFMRKSADICRHINNHFRAHGVTRLDDVEVLLDGMFTHKVIWQSNSSYIAKHRSLPFVLAVCHDFSTMALANIVRHFDIDPVIFIHGFDTWVDEMRSLSGKFLDSAVFHQKMVEAFTAIDPVSAKTLFSANVGLNSNITQAFLVAGDSYGVVDQLLEAEHQKAQRAVTSIDRSLQTELSKYAYQINNDAHLPNGSIGEYLIKSGALNRHVNQKTLALGSYWECFFAQASHEYNSALYSHNLLENCLSGEFAQTYYYELRMVLSNLAMDATENFFELNNFLRKSLQLIEKSSLSEFLTKTTFHLSLLRNQLKWSGQPTDLSALSKQHLIMDDLSMEMIRSLVALQDGFVERVMEETLLVPDEWMGFHLLTLPKIIKNIVLPEQVVTQETFEAYLQKMARCATQFKLPCVALTDKQQMDSMIDQGMAHWINQIQLSHKFDLSRLDYSHTQVNEQLIFWGVDVQCVPKPSEKAMEFALGRDLGL